MKMGILNHGARAIGASAALFCTFACSQIPTPPVQAVQAEAPALVAPQQTAVNVGIGGAGEGLGASGVTFTGAVSHGLHEKVELQGAVEGTWLQRDSTDQEKIDGRAHRGYYTGRVGAKVALFEHMALTAGLGLGHAPAAGSFFGTDVGFTVGYENPYAVPFLHPRLYYSIPFAKKDIPDHWDLDEPAAYENTMGLAIMGGLKVPIARQRALEGKATYNLYFAFGPTFVFRQRYFRESDREARSVFIHGQTRFEIVLPPPRAARQTRLEE